MVSCTTNVSDHTLSTVVPANVTGDRLHELTGLDLALKLHYLRSVYYFKPSEVMDSISIVQLKEPMFLMLDVFPEAAGRIRRHEDGRAHVKCNDSGVRIIEAKCEKTMDEWLKMDDQEVDKCKHLVYDRVIGPDLFFSPLAYVQFTKFKCGGLSIGVNWSHILGDAVSANNSISLWAYSLSTKKVVTKPENQEKHDIEIEPSVAENPLSIKKVDPVGDFWIKSTDKQMCTYSFRIDGSMLKQIQSKISNNVSSFEAISALFWRIIARIRDEKEPNLVTVIRNENSEDRKYILGNKLNISTATTDSSIAKLELLDLATLISNANKDEKKAIDDMVEKENAKDDYIVYGANLTFVDMQGVDLYGLDLKGQKPVHVDYSIHGAGEEGVILVLQGRDEGREVTVVLPEEEVVKVKEVLESEWSIA